MCKLATLSPFARIAPQPTHTSPYAQHATGDDGVARYQAYLVASNTIGKAQAKAVVDANNALCAKMKG